MAKIGWFGLFLLLVPSACVAQVHDVLCSDGNSSFETTFRTGVKVSVGPEKDGKLSTRVCQGTLSWKKEKLTIASGMSQLDLDVFGADLGSGEPVAAFTTAKAKDACCMTYQIYSLNEPPQLVRTITGGGYFSAADTDLDGDVEIWTDDSGAVDGFEGLTAGEIQFVPTYVLRLDHEHLLDASSEFQPFYDDIIKSVRSQIKPELLRDFRTTDGKLQAKPGSSAQELIRLHELRAAKIEALQLVWAYLYSGREKEAWETLTQMWPPGDVERIRGEILKARSRGIKAQLDGLASDKPGKHKRVPIFSQSEISLPQAIFRRLYPPPGEVVPIGHKEVHLVMLIDSAGKVRSVDPASNTQIVEQYALVSASRWKFIPAFKNGRAVASRIQTNIFALQ